MSGSPPTKSKQFPKAMIVFILLGVIALGILFIVLASIGDDVPTELPPATENSPGN